MKQSKKKLIIGLSIAVTFLFIIPGILFSILNWGVLPPNKLTPIVVQQTNKLIKGKFNCKKTELTFLETYPYLGIKITDGELISSALPEEPEDTPKAGEMPGDSLLSFKFATASIQPLDYLFHNQISIKDVIIIQPMIHGYVTSDGKANWDIYESDTTKVEDEESPSNIPTLSLQRIRIRNGQLIYNDKASSTFGKVNDLNFSVDGELSGNNNMLSIEGSISSLLFKNPAYTLENQLALQLKTDIELAKDYSTIKLENSELKINNIPFSLNGSVLEESGQRKIDMTMGLKVSDLNDVLKFIPQSYFKNIQNIETKGSILIDGEIKGYWNDSIYPNVNLAFKIDDGSCMLKNKDQGINKMNMNMEMMFNGQAPDSSFLAIKQIYAQGKYISLDMKGKINNLMYNPEVNANMKGDIDFTSLGKEFFNPDTLALNGQLHADFSAKFTAADLLQSRFEKTHMFGHLDIDTLKALSKPLGLDFLVLNTHLSADTTLQNNKYLNKKNLMKFKLVADSLNVTYKNEVNTNISKLKFEAHTSPQIDTTAILPLTASLELNRIRALMSDSVWVIASQTVLQGGIKSSESDKKRPRAAASIKIDSLKYYSAPLRTSMVLYNSFFGVGALPYKEAMEEKKALKNKLDSVSTAIHEKKLIATLSENDSTKSKREMSVTQKLLKQWEAKGFVSFKGCKIFSKMFPVLVNVDSTTLKFNTNDVALKDAMIHIGASDLLLNGEIHKIRQALLRNGKLKGNFNLTSNYIDGNQIVKALIVGAKISEEEDKEEEIDATKVEELTSIHATDTIMDAVIDTTSSLFTIPEFLDIRLQTNINKMIYRDLNMNDVNGEVLIRNKSLNLKELNLHSNMGDGHISMFYSTGDSAKAKSGMDLNLEKIQVAKLISLFPSMDTLVPMLRSFEGVVDCQMSGTCDIDSTMSIVIPSLTAACYMHGDSMVLLDGETFTEISKTLMFKNKKRNLIDSISVDFSVKDNKIEVFPFQVEMDRYKVAVGGTHNLDMTFNYHISVLKSPVPFKLGINITGNLDDFKIRIGKCKYKNLFKPAKLAEMQQERINLRTNMQDIIHKRIDEISQKRQWVPNKRDEKSKELDKVLEKTLEKEKQMEKEADEESPSQDAAAEDDDEETAEE